MLQIYEKITDISKIFIGFRLVFNFFYYLCNEKEF